MLLLMVNYSLLHQPNGDLVGDVILLVLPHVDEGVAEAEAGGLDGDVDARLLQIHLINGNLLVISLLLSSTWMILMRIWVVVLSQN